MGGNRNNGTLVLQVGFVLLIGLSGVFVSIQAGASTRFALLAGVGGLVVGAIVTWLVVRNLREVMPDTPDMPDREW